MKTQSKNKNNNPHIFEFKEEVIQALNLQYKTNKFCSKMTLHELVAIAQNSLKTNIDMVKYGLDSTIIDKYSIKVVVSSINPFSAEEKQSISELMSLCHNLPRDDAHASASVSKVLEQMKNFILAKGTSLNITDYYREYTMNFRYINVKEAMLYTVLSQCQIWFTICRERKKSTKEFYLDPLLHIFYEIVKRSQIASAFHTKVLPRKYIKTIQKKSLGVKTNNKLFDAVAQKQYKLVKQLILNGANLEASAVLNHDRLVREMKCAHKACANGDLQMCKILHSFGVNWESEDNQKMTPIFYAIKSGSMPVIQYLIEDIQVDFERKEIQNRTPFYFVCTEGDVNVIKYLISRGVNINSQSELGRSALSKTCYLGLKEVVEFLLNCEGINIYAQCKKGRTALHNAVFGPKGGREGHKFGTNDKDSPQCAQLLLERGLDVDYPDIEKNTPLHVAMSSDAIDSIRLLLAYGASLTKLNVYDETPLMTGSKFGHLQAVKMLYEEYNSPITTKDCFNKNMILLCAKFQQGEQNNEPNAVFYYAVDQLLKMMSSNEKPPLLEGNVIKDWVQEMNYTLIELLNNHQRVPFQLRYFITKCLLFKVPFPKLNIQLLSILLELIQLYSQTDRLVIEQAILTAGQTNQIQLTPAEIQQLLRWMINKNSITIFQFIRNHHLLIFGFQNQNENDFITIMLPLILQNLSQLKQKLLTHVFFCWDLDWPHHMDSENGQNILHVLVKSRKVGTLVQVLKVLSGIQLNFVSNIYLKQLWQQDQHFIHHDESALKLFLKTLLTQKDKEGFDPYHLAIVMKDASAAKIIEEKMKQAEVSAEGESEVKDFKHRVQKDEKELEIFSNYELEQKLSVFIERIQLSQSTKEQMKQYFYILREDAFSEDDKFLINQCKKSWKIIKNRPLKYLKQQQDLILLQQLLEEKVIGIDIEYFFSQGVGLISIMQISSLRTDFIIDFLSSAIISQQAYVHFTKQLKDKYLQRLFKDEKILKIMHGSDNDLCYIKSLLNISFVNFIDTSRIDIEIRKKSSIRGLAILAQQYLGIHMSKDYQVSEWRIRPIPQAMIDYARKDSMVLPFLARQMLQAVEEHSYKDVFINGCKHAKRNRKANQPLIQAIYTEQDTTTIIDK